MEIISIEMIEGDTITYLRKKVRNNGNSEYVIRSFLTNHTDRCTYLCRHDKLILEYL